MFCFTVEAATYAWKQIMQSQRSPDISNDTTYIRVLNHWLCHYYFCDFMHIHVHILRLGVSVVWSSLTIDCNAYPLLDCIHRNNFFNFQTAESDKNKKKTRPKSKTYETVQLTPTPTHPKKIQQSCTLVLINI